MQNVAVQMAMLLIIDENIFFLSKFTILDDNVPIIDKNFFFSPPSWDDNITRY